MSNPRTLRPTPDRTKRQQKRHHDDNTNTATTEQPLRKGARVPVDAATSAKRPTVYDLVEHATLSLSESLDAVFQSADADDVQLQQQAFLGLRDAYLYVFEHKLAWRDIFLTVGRAQLQKHRERGREETMNRVCRELMHPPKEQQASAESSNWINPHPPSLPLSSFNPSPSLPPLETASGRIPSLSPPPAAAADNTQGDSFPPPSPQAPEQLWQLEYGKTILRINPAVQDVLLIGTLPECDLRLNADVLENSRLHAIVFLCVERACVYVVDVGSANGLITIMRRSPSSVATASAASSSAKLPLPSSTRAQRQVMEFRLADEWITIRLSLTNELLRMAPSSVCFACSSLQQPPPPTAVSAWDMAGYPRSSLLADCAVCAASQLP
jgi:hypothetical protein